MENGLEGANKTESGLVYVVHNDWIQNPNKAEKDYKTYKIGITAGTVKDRYYGLGLKMPCEFECDFAYEFGGEKFRKIEKLLHGLLNQSRRGGEWFDLNETTKDAIKSACEEFGGKLVTEEVEDSIEDQEQADESVTRTRHVPTEEECKEKWEKKENRPIVEMAKYLEKLFSESGAIEELKVRYESSVKFVHPTKRCTYFYFSEDEDENRFHLSAYNIQGERQLKLIKFLEDNNVPFEPANIKGVRILIKDKAFVEQHQDMFIKVARFVKELKARA
jgi:hypothetical protein